MLKRICTFISFILISFASIAANSTTPTPQAMQESLSKAIPNIQIDSVKPAPITGFYEVTAGPTVFYVSNDSHYILYGDLLEINGDKVANLTDVTKQEYVKKALNALDPNTMIIFPAIGEEKGVVTMGTDVDCGYCRKLHNEIPALNAAGITVRYVAFPRSPAGTPSYEKSAAIWCSKDPKQTISDVYAGQAAPTMTEDCKHPLAEHTAFVRSIGASATPIIILENGQVLPGYMPATQLIPLVLEQN